MENNNYCGHGRRLYNCARKVLGMKDIHVVGTSFSDSGNIYDSKIKVANGKPIHLGLIDKIMKDNYLGKFVSYEENSAVYERGIKLIGNSGKRKPGMERLTIRWE